MQTTGFAKELSMLDVFEDLRRFSDLSAIYHSDLEVGDNQSLKS